MFGIFLDKLGYFGQRGVFWNNQGFSGIVGNISGQTEIFFGKDRDIYWERQGYFGIDMDILVQMVMFVLQEHNTNNRNFEWKPNVRKVLESCIFA